MRTLNSRCRAEERASSRFAIFAQAISSTSPTIAISVKSAVRYCLPVFEIPCPAGSRLKVLPKVAFPCGVGIRGQGRRQDRRRQRLQLLAGDGCGLPRRQARPDVQPPLLASDSALLSGCMTVTQPIGTATS